METIPSIPSGIWPVMLTPFDDQLRIDDAGLQAMIEYHLAEDVTGLYAVCGSSELLQLTADEVLHLSRRTMQIVNGRVPVIASGNFGSTLEEQIDMMRRVADTGVAVVAVATSILPSPEDMKGQLMRIMDATDFPLGVYECPIPVHRLLSVETVDAIAKTGRFHVLKETSRTAETFLAKVDVARDTPLRVFQANLKTLFATGSEYGHGFMGCLANIAPRLLAEYLSIADQTGSHRDHMTGFLRALETKMNQHNYPASAKFILSRLGVSLGTACRWPAQGGMTSVDRDALDEFLAIIQSGIRPSKIGQTIELPSEPWVDLKRRIGPEANVTPVLD